DLESAPTAAERCLYGDRQPVLVREGNDFVDTLDGIRGTGRERGADVLRYVPCLYLVAERLDCRRWWPDPHESGVNTCRCECCVLGEEAIARVDAVRARSARDIEELRDVEVTFRRRRSAQRVCLVGQAHVQRVEIGIGVDRNAGQTLIPARARDAHGDLAAVGDEDLAHPCTLVG